MAKHGEAHRQTGTGLSRRTQAEQQVGPGVDLRMKIGPLRDPEQALDLR